MPRRRGRCGAAVGAPSPAAGGRDLTPPAFRRVHAPSPSIPDPLRAGGKAVDPRSFQSEVSAAPPPRPSRPRPGDPSIRRTWWLLAGAFFVLALISGLRLLVFRQPIDWLTAGLVVLAAIAAVAHRNAVGGLESRGRGEAESFAR